MLGSAIRSHPVEMIMSDTLSVDSTTAEQTAEDETVAAMGQNTLLYSQNQLADMRDKFKEALDDAEG